MRTPLERIRVAGAAFFLIAAFAATPGVLSAQLPGLPVRNAGFSRGLTVGADVGFTNNDSPAETTVGATATLGLGLIGLSTTIAGWDRPGQGDGTIGVATSVTYLLLGGPLVPLSVTLQGGIGSWEISGAGFGNAQPAVLTIPVGVGLGLTIPSPLVSFKPWLAPRVQWTRISSFGSVSSNTTSDLALSGGIDLGFINGITLRGAYDVTFAPGGDPTTLSLGASYNWRFLR